MQNVQTVESRPGTDRRCPECGGPLVHRVGHVGGRGLVGYWQCAAAEGAPYTPWAHPCGAPFAPLAEVA